MYTHKGECNQSDKPNSQSWAQHINTLNTCLSDVRMIDTEAEMAGKYLHLIISFVVCLPEFRGWYGGKMSLQHQQHRISWYVVCLPEARRVQRLKWREMSSQHQQQSCHDVVCLPEERCAQRLRNGGKPVHNNNTERQMMEGYTGLHFQKVYTHSGTPCPQCVYQI